LNTNNAYFGIALLKHFCYAFQCAACSDGGDKNVNLAVGLFQDFFPGLVMGRDIERIAELACPPVIRIFPFQLQAQLSSRKLNLCSSNALFPCPFKFFQRKRPDISPMTSHDGKTFIGIPKNPQNSGPFPIQYNPSILYIFVIKRPGTLFTALFKPESNGQGYLLLFIFGFSPLKAEMRFSSGERFGHYHDP
jgi:hypothetical protein